MVDGNSRNEETDRIYIEWLNEMPDSKLESEARLTIWTCLHAAWALCLRGVAARSGKAGVRAQNQPEVFAERKRDADDPRISEEKETDVPRPPSEERNERSFYSSRIARTDPGFTSE